VAVSSGLGKGLGAFQPSGYACLASASDTAGTMMTSSPCFQFTGVSFPLLHGAAGLTRQETAAPNAKT